MNYLGLIIAVLLQPGLFLLGNTQDSLSVSFTSQLMARPQEKVYVQMDKSCYLPGEYIWFSAYVVDASLHQRMTEGHVYVEVIGTDNQMISRVIIKADENGNFSGNLLLEKDLREGDYVLRAYTERMKSQRADYFFQRTFFVSAQAAAETKKTNDEYDVSFFPEGGGLLADVNTTVAFKAINQSGWSENITGRIEDEKGTAIQHFSTEHRGMGTFFMKPEKGKKYYAVCLNQSGLTRRFPLPEVVENGAVIQARWQRNGLALSAAHGDALNHKDNFSLLIHTRGIVLYHKAYNNKVLLFDKDFFPSGISHILLFDANKCIVSERLVFNRDMEDEARVSFTTNAQKYAARERVSSVVSLADMEGNPLSGNISVSVIDDMDVAVDTTMTIVSSLLLTSDLKGYIECPAEYFEKEGMEAIRKLDLLMLTQGWRKYDVSEALQGKQMQSGEAIATNHLRLTGRVDRMFLPLKKAEVSLLAMTKSGSELKMTTTDNKGNFVFEDLDYPDSTKLTIQAVSKRNNGHVCLTVDEPVLPELIQFPFQRRVVRKNENRADYVARARQHLIYENDVLRTIDLPEVNVLGIKRSTSTFYSPIHSSIVWNSSDVKKSKANNLRQLLLRLPDVQARVDPASQEVFIKRMGVDEKARVVINDFPILYFQADMIDVDNIEEIFVHKSANTLVIKTKKEYGNTRMPSNIKQIYFSGYQRPVKFYSPRYETEEERKQKSDLRTTIYWSPNIRISETGTAGFDFYTADAKTNYSVVIEGMTKDGKMIHHVSKICRE